MTVRLTFAGHAYAFNVATNGVATTVVAAQLPLRRVHVALHEPLVGPAIADYITCRQDTGIWADGKRVE
ncbi:unnamed protein product [Strongylus vulgaris]|uniref:Uncharacterized protein n=1 Tax=Strongylus vulgaris TaxID=40348 RepID=A0A3P7IZL1_STRVU|nr:unnamed protein product [Strongylus vulgaris]